VTRLRVLAVDDEEPALEDVRHLLLEHSAVESVTTASDVTLALHALERDRFDAVFLDIHLPGLDGLDLARVLRQFAEPPRVVFVTAFDTHAVEAFEVDAVDYLLKPVRSERLDAALARVEASLRATTHPSPTSGAGRVNPPPETEQGSVDPSGAGGDDEQQAGAGGGELMAETAEASTSVSITIPVERGGRTRLVERADISVVESEGDYVRLHIGETSYLVRVPISKLEQEWAPAGFIRVHRSYLVNINHLDELRTEASGVLVARVAGRDVPVSRRGQRTVREFLASAARRGGLSPVHPQNRPPMAPAP
jgi:DNA-binding LytR/AlgR family response regulator